MKPIFAVLLVTLAWMNTEAYERTPLGDSIDRATLKVLKEAYQQSEDKNVITSPLGVFLLLSMFSAGAGPAGRREIVDFLGGGDRKQLTESYIGLGNEFGQMDPSYLTLANKVYVADGYDLVEAFADVVRSYGSEVDKIDFSNNQAAVDTINAWAAEKTQGHITSPVSPSDIDNDTAVALLNAIFFEGEWAVPFEKSKTKDADFYVDKDTIIKKPSMTMTDWMPYAKSKDLGASVFELDYKEEGFRAVIFMPDEIDGLPSLLEKAEQKGLLEDVFNMRPSFIRLSFPKFEIKSKLDFKEILPKVGVSEVFGEMTSEIVNRPVNLGKVLQEALVKFDEKGTVATVFTASFSLFRSLTPEPQEIKVDHPFLFYILHDDKVLFAGTYTG